MWWQFSLTRAHRAGAFRREPSKISRDRDGALELTGRSWQEDGTLSARYWSEAVKEKKDRRASSTTGKANGRCTRTRRNWTERARSGWSPRTAHPDTSRRCRTRDPNVNARTSGVYLRAEPADMSILDGRDDRQRPELIAERLKHWQGIKSA